MSYKKIYVMGSINMDYVIETRFFPKPGETVLANQFFSNSGGKGANQASSIGKLGGNPYFLGVIGNDSEGANCLKVLKENNVNCKSVFIQNSVPTGVAMINLCEGENKIAVFPGANHCITEPMIHTYLLNTHPEDLFLTQLETNFDSVKIALETAKNRGLTTILNPSPFTQKVHDIIKFVDFLVVNKVEALQLLDKQEDFEMNPDDIIRALRDLKIPSAIITLGAKGCIAYHNNEEFSISPENVKVVDTTCAGDSFVGAFVLKLSHGSSIQDSLLFANKVAALTVTKYGAQSSIPTLEEFLKIYTDVEM